MLDTVMSVQPGKWKVWYSFWQIQQARCSLLETEELQDGSEHSESIVEVTLPPILDTLDGRCSGIAIMKID